MNGGKVKITTATRVCAVIGNPVAHSLSPAMHNAAFEASGLDYVYVAFQVEDLGGCLAGMRALPGFRGMSVTIPHKTAVMPYLDEIDPLARRVGCVNTITNDAGRLKGTITDGLGTLRAFEEAGVSLDGKRILFLGAGGAVRAVAFAMAGMTRASGITILGRNPERLNTLVADLRGETGMPVLPGRLDTDLETAIRTHDVVVQGTPVGMFGHDAERSCVPREWLHRGQVVFDMVYRPLKTRLILDAEAAGCTVILGLEMLLHQAVLQFETWTETSAPRDAMRAALLSELREVR